MSICDDCKYYMPYFCIVKAKKYNLSQCMKIGKKITLKKTICKNYKNLLKL